MPRGIHAMMPCCRGSLGPGRDALVPAAVGPWGPTSSIIYHLNYVIVYTTTTTTTFNYYYYYYYYYCCSFNLLLTNKTLANILLYDWGVWGARCGVPHSGWVDVAMR